MDFYAGDDATAANRPVLELTYFIQETSQSPKAWLKFDESNGTIAADSSGNAWDGTLVNTPAWVAGKSNNAVSLSGTAHVALPTGAVNALTDFTVSTWVKLNSVTNWARIFDFGTGSGFYMFLTPFNAATGKVRFAITNAGNAGEQVIDGASALTTGSWTHVAITLSGTTGTLYVNGTAVGTNTGMTLKPASLGNTTRNFIGRSQFAADPYLNGLVDDFRIYNRALDAAEVSGLVAPPAIISPTTADAIIGSAFSYQIIATNSPTGYSASGLPAGLSVNTNTGLISGTPTVDGTASVTTTAVNASGTGSSGLTINVLPPLPPVPTGLVATGGYRSVSLSWTASSGAISYTVSRSSTVGNGYVPVGGTTTATTFNDTGLGDGVTCYYVVSATNEGGTSGNSIAATATTFTETENWRMANFGTTANTGNAADSADPDGDGFTNAREFTASTDPQNGTSFFRINQVQQDGNNIIVSFSTVPGRTYRLTRTTNLQSGSWTTVQGNIAGTGSIIQITDTNGAGQPRRFYQLIVE